MHRFFLKPGSTQMKQQQPYYNEIGLYLVRNYRSQKQINAIIISVMIEKENRMQMNRDYQLWSQEQLHNRIIMLYDQIERVTIDNLEIAQHNGVLEIQISTMDQIVRENSNCSPKITAVAEGQVTMEQYNQLLNNHIRLTDRVGRIEQFILSKPNSPSFFINNTQTTLHKVTSIQDLMKHSRNKTLLKGKGQKRVNGLNSGRNLDGNRNKY